jgi:predicted metal-dependent hydrolase
LLSIPLDDYDGNVLCIKVRTSNRAMHMRIVSSIHGIEAIIPPGYDEGKLRQFIQKKQDWIIKSADYYKRLRDKLGQIEEDTIYHLGKKYRVRLIKDRFASTVISDQLGTATFHVVDMRSYRREIEQWYREQTARVIAERLPTLSLKVGLAYNRVAVRKQKSRWASCSKKKNLNFNLFLSAAPVEVIDYVIVHELCHISEMNHSKRFWQLVGSIDPNYRKHKQWLDDHSPVIGVQGL